MGVRLQLTVQPFAHGDKSQRHDTRAAPCPHEATSRWAPPQETVVWCFPGALHLSLCHSVTPSSSSAPFIRNRTLGKAAGLGVAGTGLASPFFHRSADSPHVLRSPQSAASPPISTPTRATKKKPAFPFKNLDKHQTWLFRNISMSVASSSIGPFSPPARVWVLGWSANLSKYT